MVRRVYRGGRCRPNRPRTQDAPPAKHTGCPARV